MANLYTGFSRDDYPVLLASKKLDVSKGKLYTTQQIEPNKTDRTILIGVGGTGIQTIDHVKGEISRRLLPTWKKYVAFLGLDTSWSEFERASYLDQSEGYMYTLQDVNKRMSNPEGYPEAVRPFVPKGTIFPDLSGDGAAQKRLMGKVKIHDAKAGSAAADEKIMAQLRAAVDRLASLPGETGKYVVYVIGSGSGGTGSGGILELPAMIRQALPNRTEIHLMLYLPETVRTLDEGQIAALEANGYATLKELNYFMGMEMRPNYPEYWYSNSPANPKLEMSGKFVDLPYLIGAPKGDGVDPYMVAEDVIAQYLISILGDFSMQGDQRFLTSAFVVNMIPHKGERAFTGSFEAQGFKHEFPKCYAAIGFARASVPQKMVRAYEVGKLCEKAGLAPVDAKKRAELAAGAAAQTAILPFRGERDLLSAQAGTQAAIRILEPVLGILGTLCSVDFSFAQLVRQAITWDAIRSGVYDLANEKIDAAVQEHTDDAKIQELRRKVAAAFADFRNNVKDYVKREGPLAFWNVYRGTFASNGQVQGTGIEKILSKLVEGKYYSTEQDDFGTYNFGNVDAAAEARQVARDAINAQPAGLFGIDIGGRRGTQAGTWTSATDEWVKARILDKLKGAIVGEAGLLMTELARPAAVLAEQVRAFGILLESLTSIYQNLGKKLESFEIFENAQDSNAGINMAGVNKSAYDWILKQTRDAVANAKAGEFRERLVEDFFQTPSAWLDFSDDLFTRSATGTLVLKQPDVAIPARAHFDNFVAETIPTMIDVSIQNIFVQIKQSGTSYDSAAQTIVNELKVKSAPLFEGEPAGATPFSYIVLPEALNNNMGEGPAIRDAIVQAAKNAGIKEKDIYFSADADGILWYRFEAPFEIFHLRNLKAWESQYESVPKGIVAPGNLLHGMSPDVERIDVPGKRPVYEEHTPWSDYPPITIPTSDPRLPIPGTRDLSREGKILKKLDELVENAKELGVLYCNNEPDGSFQVYRVFCDEKIEDWSLQMDLLSGSEGDGLLPLGRDLAESVAVQNGKAFSDITAPVVLYNGGILQSSQSDEKSAWEAAKRVLRVHIPMQIEVRETVKLFSKWGEEIKAINVRLQQRFLPGMMMDMICGGILRSSREGAWSLLTSTGVEKPVANLTAQGRTFLTTQEKALVNNGLIAYFLYTKLCKALGGTAEAPKVEAFEAERDRAVTQFGELGARQQYETLQVYRKAADELAKEIKGLKGKGAELSGEEEKDLFIGELLRRNLRDLKIVGITDEGLKDILRFYYRLGLPAKIFSLQPEEEQQEQQPQE